MINIDHKTIRTDKKFSFSMVILATLGILAIGLTATSTMTPMTVQAAGGPSGCPDPGHCTCNAATGVMHDDLMPNFPINNGCTESGTF